jgi:stringent starvation protein B
MASTKPYLLRALHEWCTDNGFTPYIAVAVDDSVDVPSHVVSNHEVVLNIGYEATGGLQIGHERITFKARFSGVARDISVPINRVLAIYARENGEGMAFPVTSTPTEVNSMTNIKTEEEQASSEVSGGTPPVRSLSLVSSDASSEADTSESDDEPPPPPPNSSPTVRTLRRIK